MLLFCVVLLVSLVLIGLQQHVADWGNPLLNIVDGLIRVYCRYVHQFRYQTIAVADAQPALLAANHISGLDPLLLIAACRRPIRFMIAREQYERFGLQWLFKAAGCIPVERQGRVEKAFRASLNALQRNEVVALFPEGAIHRKAQPPEKLKPGIARLACLANIPITPIQVDGVRGEGYTLLAIIMPSRCRLYVYPPIKCDKDNQSGCLEQLALCFRQAHA